MRGGAGLQLGPEQRQAGLGRRGLGRRSITHAPHTVTPRRPCYRRGWPSQIYSVALYVEGEPAAKELGIRDRGGFFETDGDFCAALVDGAFSKVLVVRVVGERINMGAAGHSASHAGCCGCAAVSDRAPV